MSKPVPWHPSPELRPGDDAPSAGAAEARPAFTILIPVHNEAGNILALLEEMEVVLAGSAGHEVIVVDDASTDATPARLAQWRRGGAPGRRVLKHRVRAGQSAALRTGVRAARGEWIVTMDGDGQNDPADIPIFLAAFAAAGGAAQLVCGQRLQRHDSWLKRFSSRVANAVRARVLGDGVQDTGCGLKLFRREAFLALPWFDHMHRFLPALFQREGGTVIAVEIHHRPRRAGRSKYGVHNRLWTGIVDLLGVMWLKRRGNTVAADEIE